MKNFIAILAGLCLIYYFGIGPVEQPIVPQETPPAAIQESPKIPDSESLSTFQILVGLFVVTVVFRFSGITRNIGLKKTRRGALNFLFGYIRDQNETAIDAYPVVDEFGKADVVVTTDSFGSEKAYYVQNTEELNNIDPDDYK